MTDIPARRWNVPLWLVWLMDYSIHPCLESGTETLWRFVRWPSTSDWNSRQHHEPVTSKILNTENVRGYNGKQNIGKSGKRSPKLQLGAFTISRCGVVVVGETGGRVIIYEFKLQPPASSGIFRQQTLSMRWDKRGIKLLRKKKWSCTNTTWEFWRTKHRYLCLNTTIVTDPT